MHVRLGGLGGNPDDLGIKVSKTLFAPRLGAIYRLNDETVFRAGYGVTYDPLPFSRPLREFYPLTIAESLTNINPFGYATTLEQGIPNVASPDLSSGSIPLPIDAQMRSMANDVSRGRIQSWNVAAERRLPHDFVSRRGLCRHTRKRWAPPISTSMPLQLPGCGVNCQPLFQQIWPLHLHLELWGPLTRTNYHSLQVAINRPFKNGLLLEGRLHVVACKERDRRRRLGGAWTGTLQACWTAITRWLATTGRTCSRWRSSTSCRTSPPVRGIERRTLFSVTGRSTGCSAPIQAGRSRSLRTVLTSTCRATGKRPTSTAIQSGRPPRRRRHVFRYVSLQPATWSYIRQHGT